MISRLANPNLWSSWDAMPTIILIPNQGDGQRFYAMSSFRYVNADASAGSLRVRVTDLRRHSIARFDYDDCSGTERRCATRCIGTGPALPTWKENCSVSNSGSRTPISSPSSRRDTATGCGRDGLRDL